MTGDKLLVSFTDAAKNVLKQMLDLDATEGRYSVTEKAGSHLQIAVEITGDLRGNVYYSFPKETALEMVRIMSGGMEINEIDDFVTSALGEMANIISGNAVHSLYEMDMACDIRPPSISLDVLQADNGRAAFIVTDIGVIGLDFVQNK